MGTIYLMVPKVRNGGYIPFFITERKRSESALIKVIQEIYVQGVLTRKIEKLARTLRIESITRSQISEMTKGLNEQAEVFRNRLLEEERYPVLWVDNLYESSLWWSCSEHGCFVSLWCRRGRSQRGSGY